MCPGCVATYAKVLSALGVGIALSEAQHLWLLLGCVAVSFGFGIHEARLTHRVGPMVLTASGCAVLVLVHLFGEAEGWASLSWLGVALLLGGAVWGYRLRLARRLAVPHRHVSSAEPAS